MGSHTHSWSDFDVLDRLSEECYRIASEHGWWDPADPRSDGDLIALMHSELSEALEEVRAGHPRAEIRYEGDDLKPEGISVELADVLIRIFDYCGRYGVPLGRAVQEKMAYNEGRPFRHGGKLL